MTSTSAIRLEGRDALPILHRTGTQHLSDLAPGQARVTLFCDFRARLLHRMVVARTRDGAVWLLRDDGPGPELARYVEGLVFREDVRVSDRSESVAVRSVPGAAGRAAGTMEERDGVPVTIQVADDFALALDRHASPEEYLPNEVARIRAGRPRHGHEIRDEFNPMEVGLAHEVHLDKGCFTGQEALQRLVTYRSVRRRLVRVRGRGPVPSPLRDLVSGGERIGRLTSVVVDGSAWIGLAVIKHEASATTAPLEIEGAGKLEAVEALPLSRPLGRR